MTVIHVNFADREFENIFKQVRDKLEEWGLLDRSSKLPDDAIACALDDLIYFPDLEKRLIILKRLESAFVDGEAQGTN